MRNLLLIAVTAILSAIATLFVVRIGDLPPPVAEVKKPPLPPAEVEKETTIPLDTIYSTLAQPYRDVYRLGDKATREKISDLHHAIEKGGSAQSLFMIEGASVVEAVAGTRHALFAGAEFGRPVGGLSHSKHYWASFYLGSSYSSPHYWSLTSASEKANRIRICYQLNPPPLGNTWDEWPYWYFVPLGKRESGIHTIEIYDNAEQRVVLSQHFRVK